MQQLRVVVHEAEEGGFWAVVPSVPGCATRGDSLEELFQNLQQAVETRFHLGMARRSKKHPGPLGFGSPL